MEDNNNANETIARDKKAIPQLVIWTPILRKIIKQVVLSDSGYVYLGKRTTEELDQMLDLFEEAKLKTIDGIRTAMGFAEITLAEGSKDNFKDVIRQSILGSLVYYANCVGRDLI